MKKLLPFMLLAALCLQLVSCNGQIAENPETTDSAAVDSAPADPNAEYQKPAVDYKGQNVVFAAHQYEGSWKILDYQLNATEYSGELLNDALAEANLQVETELNVNLEVLALSQSERTNISRLSQLILAGDDAFQYAMVRTAALSSILSTPDQLIDMASVKTIDLSHSWWDQKSVEEYNIYGKQYTAVGDMCFFTYSAPICYFINKQMVEERALEDPYQLVADGKWTYEKMLEMAESVAGDLNGDGASDVEHDSFGYAGERDSTHYALMGCGVRYTDRDSDGNIRIALDGERISAVTERFQSLLHDRSLSLNMSYVNFTDDVIPAFKANRLLFYHNQVLVALELRDMEADFGILPQPKYNEEQKEYYATTNDSWCDNVIIPVSNGQLDMTGHVLEALGYTYQQTVKPAFIEKTISNKVIRDVQSQQMLEMIYSNIVYDVGIPFNWGDMYKKMISLGDEGASGYASVWASIERKVQRALNDTLILLSGKFDERPMGTVVNGTAYVDETGDTKDSFVTLEDALAALPAEGGNVVICGELMLGNSNTKVVFPERSGKVFISGKKGAKLIIAYGIHLGCEWEIDDIELVNASSGLGYISAMGHKLTIGEKVTMSREDTERWLSIYGTSHDSDPFECDTHIVLKGGTYRHIFGGGKGEFTGTTKVEVSGITATGKLSAVNEQGTFNGTGTVIVDLRGGKTVEAGTYVETPTVITDEGRTAVLEGKIYSQK